MIEWFVECQACGRMIRLHAHPLTPFFRLQIASLRVCRRSSLLPGEGGRGRAWSQIIRLQESLALYKSFNTLYQTRIFCPKCSVVWYVYFSYLNKGSSPALSLSNLSGKLKLPTFKVRMSYNMCTVAQRDEEPKWNCLPEPEPKLRIATPAPAPLPYIYHSLKKFYRKKSWLLKSFL